MSIEGHDDLPQLNDPKIQEAITKVLKDISNQMTMIEGYRAAIGEQLKGLKEEHNVPQSLLRKLARAYHAQNFETQLAEQETFQEVYHKLFGNDEG